MTGRQRSWHCWEICAHTGRSWSSWKEWFWKWRGLEIKSLALSSFPVQETDGMGFLHRVFATDGVNFYGRVPQRLEVLPKSSYVFAAEIWRKQSNAGFLGHVARKSTAPEGSGSGFRSTFPGPVCWGGKFSISDLLHCSCCARAVSAW